MSKLTLNDDTKPQLTTLTKINVATNQIDLTKSKLLNHLKNIHDQELKIKSYQYNLNF